MPVYKILLSFVAGIILIFLVFATFFSPTDYSGDFSLEAYGTGIFEIKIDGNNIKEESYSGSDLDGKFMVHKMNMVDSIYFSSSDYEMTQSGNIVNLELGKGEFLLDVRSTDLSYKVGNQFFGFELLSPGKIYINTTDEKIYHIFSVDSFVSFLFRGRSGENFNPIYLYPHMYIGFKTSIIRTFKDSDFFKVLTVLGGDIPSHFSYFGENLISGTKVSPRLFLKSPELETEFFKNSIFVIDSEYDKSEKSFIKVRRTILLDFPGAEYIEKYKKILMNDTKRNIYNKDLILKNVLRLLKSGRDEDGVINIIVESLGELKKSEEDYNDMINSINAYYRLVSINSDPSFDGSKRNMYSLVQKINSSKVVDSYNLFLPLTSIYSYFDFDDEGIYFYDNLVTFSNTFFKKINIDEDDKNENNEDNTDEEKKKEINEELKYSDVAFRDYFYFFLKEVFLSKFVLDKQYNSDLFKGKNLNNMLKIMEEYIKMSKKHYLDSEKDKDGITESVTEAIYVYRSILDKLDYFIKLGFFKERNDNAAEKELLDYRKENIRNHKNAYSLEDDIKEFFDFFQENKNYLPSQKRKNEENYYADLDSRFKEYFSALKDYAKYKEEYGDVTPVNNTIDTRDEDKDKLTEKKFFEYIGKFNGLQISSMGVEIKDDYYNVYGLYIGDKNLSFYLYPNSNYLMENIKENNKQISGTYKIGNIPDPDFFIDRFFPKKPDGPETCEKDPEICCGDDKKICCDDVKEQCKVQEEYILRFIRDNLLEGDFKDLIDSQVFTISFPNIKMKKNDDGEYDIFIKNAIFVKGGSFEFSSEYVRNGRTKVFRDIVLKPYRMGENIDYMSTKVMGIMGLNDFEDDMEFIAKNYPSVESVFDKILEVLDVSEISITYIMRNGKFNLKFDYGGEMVNIVLVGNESEDGSDSEIGAELENIFVGNSAQGLLLRPTGYRNIEKYLNKIKELKK